ncbi:MULTISPECIES: hypothetical protein [Sphingobacterium]|uniref:hypothetical protein n=1 Tax=Sphingobacterium TaxID=28453 RepID=UPI0012FDD991|nr:MULTISPECIES: hypothetical protein [Sphingobacterium]UQA77824.1 hypothetical protein K2F45_12900 [Sphingobacterium siyangense]
MIKYFYLVIAFAAIAMSCDNRANNSEETLIDTAVNQNGLPLDNIHRSRGKDTTKNDGSAKEGVPLDNLDRGKNTD